MCATRCDTRSGTRSVIISDLVPDLVSAPEEAAMREFKAAARQCMAMTPKRPKKHYCKKSDKRSNKNWKNKHKMQAIVPKKNSVENQA